MSPGGKNPSAAVLVLNYHTFTYAVLSSKDDSF